jgi:membrane associated rhomboid family serine protease
MLTVGGILAEYVGYQHEPLLLYALIVLGPVWVWVVHTIHHKEGTEFAKRLGRIDYYFRVFMIVAILASVVYHWSTGALVPYPWLAAKLVIFAFLIFCGFMIRKKIPPFIQGFRTLASTGATPESDRLMAEGMGACRPYVLAIWAGVAISALIGVLKPGA